MKVLSPKHKGAVPKVFMCTFFLSDQISSLNVSESKI